MNLHTLEPRLENWASAQRSAYRPASTNSAEGMYRGGYRESRARPADIDHHDAALVNAAWRHTMPLDREVLQMHYVWRKPSYIICRVLRIKQGVGKEQVWEYALWHAQEAIWQSLYPDELVNVKIRAYNARRLLTPA